MIYAYKGTPKGGKVAINVPTTFEYNPETHKVIGKYMKQQPTTPESPLNFSMDIYNLEHTADEVIDKFKGLEEFDATQSVWD